MVIQTVVERSGVDPQVKFEASEHGSVVLAGLTKLRANEQLFDVVLVVDNERLPAHRVVLASCCEYFRAMFTDGLRECQLDEITMNGVTATGMKCLIDFAYSSRIVIDADNVEDVLSAANHIQIIPVIEACVNFLKSHIVLSNCIDMASIAELFSLHDLRAYVYKFISRNLSALFQSGEFFNLSADQLNTLLDLNNPVDCTECDVLSALIGWIVHNHGHSAVHAYSYLANIDFSSVGIDELENMINKDDLDRLCIDPVDGCKIKNLTSAISVNPDYVAGLINKRGYKKTLVVCGGFRPGCGMVNDLHFYEKPTRSMQYLTSVPHVVQCNFGLAVLGNKLYIVGGCYNDDQMEEISHGYSFCYDPVIHKWRNIKPMINERCRFYLGAVDNKLYVIGGDPSASLDSIEFARCECYDVETDSWAAIAPLPGNRMEHAGVSMGDSLYISGGLQDQDGPVFNTFFQYDTVANTWLQLSSMLVPRADHTMITHAGKIFALGGWFEDAVSHQRVMAATVDCFDLKSGQWSVVSELPSPRLYASYTFHLGQVYIIGGWLNGDYLEKSRTIQRLDVKTFRIQEEVEDEEEVWEHAGCSLYLPVSL